MVLVVCGANLYSNSDYFTLKLHDRGTQKPKIKVLVVISQ